MVAVDKVTGKNRWKADREPRGAWTSPAVAARNDRAEVIASSAGTIIGYAADTGKELWKLDNVVGNTLPSASVAGDRVLFGGGTGRTKEDAPAGAKGNGCLKLVGKDERPGFEVAWTAKVGISNYATPLGYEGVAYFVNQVGVVHGHDLATGKELFSERLDGACWASPLGGGGHIYFFGKDGVTTVLKAGKEFDKVASNRLWGAKPKPPANAAGGGKGPSPEYLDPIVYGAAAADGALFVRTGTKLYRVGR